MGEYIVNLEMGITLVLATKDQQNAEKIQSELSDFCHILVCWDGESILNSVFANQPRMLLIDPDLDGIDGIEVAMRIRSDPATSHISIFFLLPARPEVPAFLQKFGKEGIGVLTRPYGKGEIRALVTCMLEGKYGF